LASSSLTVDPLVFHLIQEQAVSHRLGELLDSQVLLLKRRVELRLVALKHLFDLVDLALHILLGDGGLVSRRLLAQHLHDH
jgi:hypothetical protein